MTNPLASSPQSSKRPLAAPDPRAAKQQHVIDISDDNTDTVSESDLELEALPPPVSQLHLNLWPLPQLPLLHCHPTLLCRQSPRPHKLNPSPTLCHQLPNTSLQAPSLWEDPITVITVLTRAPIPQTPPSLLAFALPCKHVRVGVLLEPRHRRPTILPHSPLIHTPTKVRPILALLSAIALTLARALIL